MHICQNVVNRFYLGEKLEYQQAVHWIWGHQITQIQIKSEKFEDFDWIS